MTGIYLRRPAHPPVARAGKGRCSPCRAHLACAYRRCNDSTAAVAKSVNNLKAHAQPPVRGGKDVYSWVTPRPVTQVRMEQGRLFLGRALCRSGNTDLERTHHGPSRGQRCPEIYRLGPNATASCESAAANQLGSFKGRAAGLTGPIIPRRRPGLPVRD